MTAQGKGSFADFNPEELPFPITTPIKLRKLLCKMLHPDPEQRISAFDICEDEWFIEMEKLSFVYMKKAIIEEEMNHKKLIDKLMCIKFSNRLSKLV